MNARNGKIARLPRPVGDELNQRLERSAESPEVLEWLSGLPEVKAALAALTGQTGAAAPGPQISEGVSVGNGG
jgi:hypothetical protein